MEAGNKNVVNPYHKNGIKLVNNNSYLLSNVANIQLFSNILSHLMIKDLYVIRKINIFISFVF